MERKLSRGMMCKMFLMTALLLGGLVLVEGQTAIPPVSGNGSAGNPYRIASLENLYWIGASNYVVPQPTLTARLSSYYIQTDNINVNATSEWYARLGWLPIGNQANRFRGKYDGNGQTISGLFLNRLGSDNQGLFGFAEEAFITNLGVIDARITGGEAVGALAGFINDTEVVNCYSTGNVTGLSYTGGLVGRSSGNSVVLDCYSEATVSINEPDMVFVQGATFSPTTNLTVTLSSFYISKNEITQSEWIALMDGVYSPNWTDRGQGPTHPAYRISWFDAIEYCNRLSLWDSLNPCYSYGDYGTNPDNWPTGWNTNNNNHTNVYCNWDATGYRLPTEMEWEFAARGGVPAQNRGTFNDPWAATHVEERLVYYAWYMENSGGRTHPVGTKFPNELGLYDMSGNVRNWVWDIRGVYPPGVHPNPTGPTTGSNRVFRGGDWGSRATNCTVSYRNFSLPTDRYFSNGFRIAKRVP